MFPSTTSAFLVMFAIANPQGVLTSDQDVLDLVNQIANLPFFIPGIKPFLGPSVRIALGAMHFTVDNFISNKEKEGSSSHDSLFAKQLTEIIGSMNQMKYQIPNEVQINSNMNDLYKKINEIRDVYDEYVFKYHSGNLSYRSHDAKLFVERSYSSENGLKSDLNSIAHILIGEGQSQTLLQGLQITTDFETMLCSKDNTHQVRIVQINHDIMETEFKALQLAYFRFNVTTHSAANSEELDGAFLELRHFFESFKKRTTNLQRAIREAMKKAPREFWKCDPEEPNKGNISIKLDPLFRTIMVRQKDLKEVEEGGGLMENLLPKGPVKCDNYKETWLKDDAKYSNQNPCQGTIRDCDDCTKDATVCVNRIRDGYKYEYITFEDGEIWGRGGALCENKLNFTSRSWSLPSKRVCLCTCDEDKNDKALRYFSTLECSSDYDDNKVVTGARLIQHGLFIHFEIQQAVLKANGDVGEPEWSPNCTKRPESDFARSNFYKLTWKNNKINLDDLSCLEGRVVTGLKFGEDRQDDQNSLRLELRCTSFNFTSGALDSRDHIFEHVSSKRPSKGIDNHLPTTAGNTHVLDGVGSSISFTKSNDEQDVGSTLVPWIDIQRVSVKNPTPLAGISLIHRSGAHSSGYLALKITSLDFSPYFESGFEEYLLEFSRYIFENAKKAIDSLQLLQNGTLSV